MRPSRHRSRRTTAGSLPPWLTAALFGLSCWATSLHAELKVGDALPLLKSEAFGNAALPDTKGKVVMMDFWASWCVPCKASFPAYARIYKEFIHKGLVIIAVSVDQDASAYATFVQKQRPPFSVIHDKAQALVRAVKVPTMPTAYVFGRDGKLRTIHVGFHGSETETELRRLFEILLSEKEP